MTTVGFIGSGHIGGTVAHLAVDAGYDVVLSNSRGPETLAGLVGELGARAHAATPAEAAAAGDMVVVSIPMRVYESVPAGPTAGKTVMDTNNYYPTRDGHIPTLDDGSTTSSELLQRHLPDAHVVKVFNNIQYRHLHALPRPRGAPDRSVLPIAGDDVAAKRAVAAFLDTIGYDAVDAGTLAAGSAFEPGTPAYLAPYGPTGAAEGTPANEETVRTLISAAM